MPTLNLTLSMRQSRGTDVVMSSNRLNSLHRSAVNLIFPDTTLTTYQKLKEMRIMSLQKQLGYNKGCSCNGSLTMRPQSTYLTCAHTLPHAVPTLGNISLVCLGQG